MYEEIFDDLQKVTDELTKAGLRDIPSPKIFNLLEILKSPKIVSQIIMESKELYEGTSSNSDSDIDLLVTSSNLAKTHNGTDVEVIKELKSDSKSKITVDLTKVPEKNASLNEFLQDDDYIQNDASNDSDVDNYYTNSDYEEDKVEDNDTKIESPPPILSILKDLTESYALPPPEVPSEIPFDSVREAENFEILEENNNDPNNNNNLEEIQLGEQTQPKSPVAGCSRDFNEIESGRQVSPIIMSITSEESNNSETRCSHQDSLEPQPSCSKEYIQLEESDDSEVEELDSKVSFKVNYEKLLEETEAINRFFPDISGDAIFSMLDKNRKATNRVTIVLWDLLPTDKPEPHIPEKMKKRKQGNDPYPLNIKKNGSPFASSKIDDITIKRIQEDVRNSEKPDIFEIDPSHTEDIKTEKCSIKASNSATKSSKESSLSPNDKGKKPQVIKPAQFVYKPKVIAGKQPEIIKRNILSAPKLIINAPIIQSAPKRKLPSPKTNELSEEGFISEDIETGNTAVLLQNPLSAFNIKKVKNSKDETNDDGSLPSKKSKASENIGNTSPTFDYDSIWSPINDLIADDETFINKSNIINKESKLEFLKPNQENKFYQMPANPMASTSSVNQPHHTALAANTIVIKPKIEVIPNKDTYYKLRSIFPDIDPSFIKEKCINPPFSMAGLNIEQQLNMFVEVLLADGGNHQIHEIREESDDVGNKDEQYETLLGIFPEADPEFLRKFVDENYKSPDNLKNFIQKNLENPVYPTRAQYLEKIKINQQIKDYTTDFSVKKFLQIFPNPVEHFEKSDRKCAFKPMANEFLKDTFRRHKVATISQIYRRRNHHLSLTANDLRNLSPDMKGKRSNYLMPTEDIPLLQEMAYIKFKNDIVTYLEDIKRQELQDFNNLKEQGLLLECQCCFNDECLPRKCSTCEDGHIFCHGCILRGTESKISDGQNHIPCFVECKREFSLSVLQEVLPPTTFSILLQKRQEAEVMAAGLEGLVSCPFCHFASIPPVESKVFKCLNPDCMKETCRLCNALNHVPLRCDEVLKEDEARLKLEEKMTEALVRTCYKCQKPFFKEEGCNKMTCVCGASMCYLCSTPLKNGDYKHFNGQGSSNSNLCPLWTDNRRMNAEAVRKIAEVTENELRKKNPNLKVTAKSILPTLPPKTRGPHDDIPNANALPEYILRIANNP
ncbi:uncharacterized protein LOC127282129 [Leptopilina boulardi]|uniref:uncharacterized protein LOC127282129 n=1 Tax=Leptopilina boulardi TaxID=63433 RepID=UPI0021F631AF|nr:uncharacterized protein LOC127282129 [Leptopilina boulardi]